jgi:hypothetical protein
MSTVIHIDGRGRITLGAMAKHTYYIAEIGDDDVIVLTPAAVLPKSEVTDRIDAFLDHPETGTRRTRPAPGGGET